MIPVLRPILYMCAFTTIVHFPANATQPGPRRLALDVTYKAVGPDIRVTNNEQTAFRVVLSPGRLNSIPFSSTETYVGPGSVAYLTLKTPAVADGRQILHINATLYDSTGRAAPVPVSSLQVYRFTKGVAQLTTFEEAYLNTRTSFSGQSDKGNVYMGAGYTDPSPLSNQTWATIPTPQLPIPVAVPFADPAELLMLPLGAAPVTNELATGGYSGALKDAAEPPVDELVEVEQPLREAPSGKGAQRYTVTPILTGYLNVLDRPDRLLSGWGFSVTVWQRFLGSGIWMPVGSADVNRIGWWSTTLNWPYTPGTPVRIEYRSSNRLFSVVDPSGNSYAWSDEVVLPGSYLNIGSRTIDLTTSGTLPGLGEIVYGGGMFWSKLVEWGINPVGPAPYRITYPNSLSTGHCSASFDGAPTRAWSCSETSGNIWLVPEHADRSVVQHEIAHSVHRTFWGGRMPSGSGGPHFMERCHNAGLALSEGFATYLAHAVQFPFDAWGPRITYFNYNIEDPSREGFCAGATNESWVSALLWDQYDYWNDGPSADRSDTTFMTARGGPAAMILRNPRDSVVDYIPLHTVGQPSDVQTRIYAEHRLNTIIW
jgi:hypothetical protein